LCIDPKCELANGEKLSQKACGISFMSCHACLSNVLFIYLLLFICLIIYLFFEVEGH
jgi:hypothetical protein